MHLRDYSKIAFMATAMHGLSLSHAFCDFYNTKGIGYKNLTVTSPSARQLGFSLVRLKNIYIYIYMLEIRVIKQQGGEEIHYIKN